MRANPSNNRLRLETETKILVYLQQNPHSHFNEIRKGMLAKGWKISDVTLSAHLKRMRVPGGAVIPDDDGTYSYNEKTRQKTVAAMQKVMKASANRAGMTMVSIRSLSDPGSKIEVAFDWLLSDFVTTLHDALRDRDRMEGYLIMSYLGYQQTLGNLIIALWDDPASQEAVNDVFDQWRKEQDEKLAKWLGDYFERVPEVLRPLARAYIESFRKVGVRTNSSTLDSWLDAILAGGLARQAFLDELGSTKVEYRELLRLKELSFPRLGGSSLETRPAS